MDLRRSISHVALYYIYVFILLYMCPHTATCVLIPQATDARRCISQQPSDTRFLPPPSSFQIHYMFLHFLSSIFTTIHMFRCRVCWQMEAPRSPSICSPRLSSSCACSCSRGDGGWRRRSRGRCACTEVGPPERDKTEGSQELNDVWVRSRSASDRLY